MAGNGEDMYAPGTDMWRLYRVVTIQYSGAEVGGDCWCKIPRS